MLTNQAIGALASSRAEKRVEPREVVEVEAHVSLSWVVLPKAADGTKPAETAVRDLAVTHAVLTAMFVSRRIVDCPQPATTK